MIGRENFQEIQVNKEIKVEKPRYDEDILEKKNPYMLEKDPFQQFKSKEAEDIKSGDKDSAWLSANLEKLLEKNRKQEASGKQKAEEKRSKDVHTEDLREMLMSTRYSNSEDRKLVHFPTKSVLAPKYNDRYRERLSASKRIEKRNDSSSELYQKKKNKQMIINARDNYAKSCIKGMKTLMEGRAVTCEGAEYKDLAQFMGTNEAGLTQEEKKSLLDNYLGTSKGKGDGEYEGRDRQRALDLMTKALFSIDVPSIRLDSDISFVQNAGKLEAIMGMVVAYEHMLQRYETTDENGTVHTYFDDIDESIATVVKEQMDRLRILSLYYVNRRDIITNSYYADHQNNEISKLVDNATDDQKKLSQMLLDSTFIGEKLMQTYGAKKEVIAASIGDSIITGPDLTMAMIKESRKLTASNKDGKKLQMAKLEEAFKSMDYFGINGFGVYTSEAVRCSTGFAMLSFAMKDLERNSGVFDCNSFEMKLVKKHLKKVKEILKGSASGLGFYDAKNKLSGELSELVNCCAEYKKARKGIASAKRYENVERIDEASASCLKFVQSMSEEQFEEITEGKKKASLFDVFAESNMIVDQNKVEKSRSQQVFLRNQHQDLKDSFEDAYGSRSDFRNYGSFIHNIDQILESDVDDNEKSFGEKKKNLIRNYNDIIKLGDSYIKARRPSMSGGVNRCSIAREAVRNAKNMIELISRMDFADLKTKNKNGLTYKDALFGDDIVNIYEVHALGEVRIKVQGGSSDTIFSADKEVINTNRYTKAIKFVGGDTSMFRDYKTSVYKKIDGSIITGLSYNPNMSFIPKGHVQGKYRYVTADEIMRSAQNNNLNIVYSEKALKQLATIRIMDTIFGKGSRNMNTLQYNAATQPVLGEMSIVISSVLNTSNDGYFGRTVKAPGEKGKDDPNEKDVSILDENGDLNIGAYDRNVADRVMSLSAEGCFAEFEKSGITLTDEEKTAFTERLSRVQAAFLKDKTDANGWRKKQDEIDEQKRLSRIENEEKTIKKFKRWKLADDSMQVKGAKKRINDLKVLKVRDEDGIYNSSLKQMQAAGKSLVLVKEEFMDKKMAVEKEATLEKEKEEFSKTSKQKVSGAQRARRYRLYQARCKILELRESRSGFKSVSDKYRMYKKGKFLTTLKPFMNGEIKPSPEFEKIMAAVKQYAEMDVTVVNGLKETNLKKSMPKYREDFYKQEGEALLNAQRLTEERLTAIPENTTDEVLKTERKMLLDLEKLYDELMAGKLQLPNDPQQITVVEDKAFVETEIDNDTNTVTKTSPQEMTMRTDEPLFTHEPCVNDICQGWLGDCYLLSTIAAIVEKKPDTIRKMMVDNGNGTVTVKLFGTKGPKYITVTKSTAKDKDMKFDRGGDMYVQGALWVKMLEKAFVASGLLEEHMRSDVSATEYEAMDRISIFEQLSKEHMVSFESISGGGSTMAAKILLGIEGKRHFFSNNEPDYDDVQLSPGTITYTNDQTEFLQLAGNIGKEGYFRSANMNYALTVTTEGSFDAGEETRLRTNDQERGVFIHHVYTVLGLRDVGGIKTVVLRNPWGTANNTFSYNENTGAVSSENETDATTGGIVYIPVNTFFRMFNGYSKIQM